MAAPNDPRQPPTPTAASTPTPTPAVASPQRLAKARPESTVTLMVQSGQAPGGLVPTQSPSAAPAKNIGPLARAWAALKSWF